MTISPRLSLPAWTAVGCRLLTRTGLDWTRKYPAIADALQSLPAKQAYLDGELCGLRSDGTIPFDIVQKRR